jgi:hypothetical protein
MSIDRDVVSINREAMSIDRDVVSINREAVSIDRDVVSINREAVSIDREASRKVLKMFRNEPGSVHSDPCRMPKALRNVAGTRREGAGTFAKASGRAQHGPAGDGDPHRRLLSEVVYVNGIFFSPRFNPEIPGGEGGR